MKVKNLVSVCLGLLCSIPPTFALFGSDLCRVKCNYSYCSQSQEQFQKCLYGCKHLDPIPPVMTMCLAGGKSSGFAIPSDLQEKYAKKAEEKTKEHEEKMKEPAQKADEKKSEAVDKSSKSKETPEKNESAAPEDKDPVETLKKELSETLEKRQKLGFHKKEVDRKLFDDLATKAKALFEKLKSPLDLHQRSLYMGEINGYVNSLKMILDNPKKKRSKARRCGEAPSIEYTQMRKVQSAKTPHKREPKPTYDDEFDDQEEQLNRTSMKDSYQKSGTSRTEFDEDSDTRKRPFK